MVCNGIQGSTRASAIVLNPDLGAGFRDSSCRAYCQYSVYDVPRSLSGAGLVFVFRLQVQDFAEGLRVLGVGGGVNGARLIADCLHMHQRKGDAFS